METARLPEAGERKRKQKITVIRMTGNVGNQLAWSKQVNFNEKYTKDHEKSRRTMKEKERRTYHWDLDVQPLISSAKWLQLHGLRKNKLTLSQILSQIGFEHKEDYVSILGKLVASRYANGLYHQYRKVSDGKLYNNCLTGIIALYQQRMEWLTTESRQIFGVIQEQNITIVLDFGAASIYEFDLCREALCMVLKQQVAQIDKFNLIRVAQDIMKWQEKAVFVTEDTIAAAVEWLWSMKYKPAVGPTGSTEAILEALLDHTTEAVYYFVVGDIPECMKNLLIQKLSRSPHPVHTVSFNAREEETVAFLKELNQLTTGRFHAFVERTDDITLTGTSYNDDDEKATLTSRKLKGRLPLGTGVREDVYLIWKELEEARYTLIQVQRILTEFEQSETVTEKIDQSECKPRAKDYMTSKEWLQTNGLKAQNLTISKAFADCAFRHADGVVDIKTKPADESFQTNAETNKKIIHAKYCNKFMHIALEDGSILHLYLKKERCKEYEDKLKNALFHMEERLQELKQGSRALFGDVTEDHIYILIDVSQSMIHKLPVVKEKIYQLLREQFRNKTRFNFVKFDAKAVAWKEKLSKVNERNLEDALLWIKELQVGDSTNILKALQIAFSDHDTQAIYLLTDGRPDQNPSRILAELKLQRNIPIHTISFNCDDIGANKFLHELASVTGGRFHYYHICFTKPGSPKPSECEDIYLMKKEIEQGENQLKKVQSFCTESTLMDVLNGAKDLPNKHRKQTFATVPVTTQVEGLNPPSPERPFCASEEPASAPPEPGLNGFQAFSESPATKKKVLFAEQTKSSMLRTQRYASKHSEQAQNGRASAERKEQKTEKADQKINKESLDISSAQWLKTHGLVARRLTIMDALAPTAVPRTTKYIPILDKHVVSRVFDDIFPFAHVSNDKKFVTLLNPQAVDLDAYKKKLQEAIKTYERRLDQIIWRALPQEEKDKFEQDQPVSFVEHKESLLEALANADWPVANEDIVLLEDEILTGLTYLEQARELQAACKEEPQRICPLRVCPAREGKKHLKPRKVDTLKGQKVLARSEGTGFYYPGVVVRSITAFYALVDFANGETEIVPLKFIMPVGGAMPCPPLQVGDYVLTRIRKQLGEEYYVPGVVIATPHGSDDKLYTVVKYNNKKEHCVRNGLIKISHRRYTCSCCYINMTRMMDYLIPNVKVAKHFHRAGSDATAEKKPTSIRGDWKRRSGRGRAKRKKEGYQEWASSDSDETVFVPRTMISKQRENNSEGEEGSANTMTACSGLRCSYCPNAGRICLSPKANEDRPPQGLLGSCYPPLHPKSSPQRLSSSCSSSSSHHTTSSNSLSSIEKVEELARRLQQYHIAQRKDQLPVANK